MNDKSTMNKIMEYMALGKPMVQFDLTEGRFSAGESSLYAAKALGVIRQARLASQIDEDGAADVVQAWVVCKVRVQETLEVLGIATQRRIAASGSRGRARCILVLKLLLISSTSAPFSFCRFSPLLMHRGAQTRPCSTRTGRGP